MSLYLHDIHAQRYGALHDRRVGPFAPGLNVVFGPNEAGKSTIASLVGGVLFGWEQARGVSNTYRPDEGERSGALSFVEAPERASAPVPAPIVLSRMGDEGDVLGDSSIVGDIDRRTYKAMFSLTSDELRTLRNSSDITARLLTAASGTATSPSRAFNQIEQRIVQHTSQAEDAERSAIRLAQQLEEKREQLKAAAEAAERYKQEDRELQELKDNRAAATRQVEELNAEIERLATCCSELQALDDKAGAQQAELDSLNGELAELAAQRQGESGIDARLLALDSSRERVLRDRLDEFAEAREKSQRIVDAAKENSASSTAAYEALVELGRSGAQGSSRSAGGRRLQAAVSIVPTLAFILAGVTLFVHGRQINSLSFTALGMGLVVLAFFLAAAAIVVLFRSDQGASTVGDRMDDAQWVMLQDKKKLDSSLADDQALEGQIASYLDEAGLTAANGSIRQARSLLDEAREVRARLAAEDQRAAAVELRIQAAAKSLQAIAQQRLRIQEELGLDERATVHEANGLLRQKSAQRDALLELSDGMSLRFGELSRELEQARQDRSFDRLKLEYQLLSTRLDESKRELVELLLARRMLERSIASWESGNQPQVYAEASRLLALITGGAWVQVSMSTSGSVLATSTDGTSRKPRHLSLGTCQQLYLALRIAMLLCAQDVGRAIPVLADDILVHFDAARRLGAARALAQLAQKRQVIVFTSHQETLTALQEATPSLTILNV